MSTTTANVSLLTRGEIWSSELKETLKEDLMATQYVKMLDGFPDGDSFTIPSIGDARTDDYVEDSAVQYRPLDTGEFQFSITEYLSSGHYITKKAEQDMYYMSQLVSSFVPKQRRAIMEHFEATALAAPEASYTTGQTGSINGALHRFAAGGTGADGVLEVEDFAYALYALKKANVPQTNLVAIVDPSIEYQLNTLSNLTSVSNNPRWEGIVADGIATGMRFVKNVYGFDVYTSNFLADVSDASLVGRGGANAADFSTVNGKANLFFSAANDILPMVGAWRQMPDVDVEYNKDFQRTEFVTTCRYGVKHYRPENTVTVVSNSTV
tara:strand:- start:4723 stop:5694 length:972 start_codon:yes stop_codon:yes gene_type:complete